MQGTYQLTVSYGVRRPQNLCSSILATMLPSIPIQEAEMFLPIELSPARRASFLAGVLCSFVAANAMAATNMYIEFEEPAIAGSNSSAGHEHEIEILSWSQGFVQPTSPTRSTAGSGTVEQATHQTLSFTKYLDSATDTLLKYCWSGRQIGKATIACFRTEGSEGNQPVKYLTIEMEHVVISNYSISGGPGDLPVETVSLIGIPHLASHHKSLNH